MPIFIWHLSLVFHACSPDETQISFVPSFKAASLAYFAEREEIFSKRGQSEKKILVLLYQIQTRFKTYCHHAVGLFLFLGLLHRFL